MVRHRPKKVPVRLLGDFFFMDLWMVCVLSLLCCSTSNEWSSVYAQTFPKGWRERQGIVWEALLRLKPAQLGSQAVVPEKKNEPTEA